MVRSPRGIRRQSSRLPKYQRRFPPSLPVPASADFSRASSSIRSSSPASSIDEGQVRPGARRAGGGRGDPAAAAPVVGRVAWPVARRARRVGPQARHAAWSGGRGTRRRSTGRRRAGSPRPPRCSKPHTDTRSSSAGPPTTRASWPRSAPTRSRPSPRWRSASGWPGRVLHCVTNALPYTQAGYTVRTHRIVTAQKAAGLDPHVVTSWGWPMLQGHADADAVRGDRRDPLLPAAARGHGEVPFETPRPA